MGAVQKRELTFQTMVGKTQSFVSQPTNKKTNHYLHAPNNKYITNSIAYTFNSQQTKNKMGKQTSESHTPRTKNLSKHANQRHMAQK